MKEPALYRSDDGGRTWKSVNRDHDLLERPQYYTRFAVSPRDADRLYVVGVRFVGTSDGGVTKMPTRSRASRAVGTAITVGGGAMPAGTNPSRRWDGRPRRRSPRGGGASGPYAGGRRRVGGRGWGA